MTEFPTRVENVDPSATVEISNIARSLEADGTDVIDLSAGDPDFDTPSHIREYAIEKLNQGKTHYTASPGIPELREHIASKLRGENDIETTSGTVIVTPGAKQAVFESLFALIRGGDEVILPQPAWVSYEPLIRMCDGTVTPVQLAPQEDFGISPGRFSDAITDETRAIILNTPSNPTGAVYSKSELEAIRDLAVDHDVYVIADEIYEKLVYEGEHVSIGSLEGMAERTITVNGFSKSHAMTGWRVGYLACPEEVYRQAAKVHSHTVTCATSFAQHGAIAALDRSDSASEAMRSEFDRRRTKVVEKLRTEGIDVSEPPGSFYFFLATEARNAVELCERLLKEHHVAVTPGAAFGMEGYIRVAYTTALERLIAGIDRIKHVLA